MKKSLLISFLTLFISVSALAQNGIPADGDELREKLKTEQLNVGFLLQSVGSFSFQDDAFNGGRRFGLGATRLNLQGELQSNFIYRLQLDFRNNPSILDAQIGYKFSDQFTLVAGQFKPFLSADLDPSPAETDFINRARLVGAMMNSREIGLTALGESGQFNYALGMYNGYGRSVMNDNRFMYTVRGGYTHELQNGDLTVGLNGALNTSQFEQVGNTGLISVENRLLYGLYGKYDSDNWFGTIEFLQTKFERFDIAEDETITGFYVTAGNNITDADQILVRWDHLSYDILANSSERVVLGWNRQVTSLISVQLNMLGQFNEFSDDQFGISGNLQFHF